MAPVHAARNPLSLHRPCFPSIILPLCSCSSFALYGCTDKDCSVSAILVRSFDAAVVFFCAPLLESVTDTITNTDTNTNTGTCNQLPVPAIVPASPPSYSLLLPTPAPVPRLPDHTGRSTRTHVIHRVWLNGVEPYNTNPPKQQIPIHPTPTPDTDTFAHLCRPTPTPSTNTPHRHKPLLFKPSLLQATRSICMVHTVEKAPLLH